MQSFKGVVINLGRSGAFQRHASGSAQSLSLSGVSCNKIGNILSSHISTSTSSPQESGGFFNSFFGGEKVELQHAPHKEVYIQFE